MPNAIVEPKSPELATAPVEPTDAATPQTQSSGLPPEILQSPAMQAILSGAPPAVSDSLRSKRPEFALIAKHKDALLGAGLGLYRSLSGDTGVLFNQLYIHGDDLLAADKLGKLLQIAPPVDQVAAAVSRSGTDNPVLSRNSVPGAFAAPQTTTPPQSSSGLLATPASDGAGGQNNELQSKVLGARLKNSTLGAPTTGPAPGRGRLLNKILSPVI